MDGTIEEVALWLIATARRHGPRSWEETDAMQARTFPDLSDEKLVAALSLAGDFA